MGFHQTTKHKNGKGSFHQIGLVRGQFGNVPMDGWVKFVARHRLRRLGRSRLGTRPAAVRHRCRGRQRTPGARGPRQEARPGNLHRRHPPARPGARRRADRQDAPVRRRRGGRGVQGVAGQGQQAAADRSVFCAAGSRQAGSPAGAKGPARLRAAGRITSASCKIARCRCRASSVRRPTAGAIGSCSRRCRARSAAMRFPTCAQVSLELLVERFGPVLDLCKTIRRDVRSGMPSERTGDGRPGIGERLHQSHEQGRLRGRRRLQPRRLAHGMAERLGDRSSSASSASSSTVPTSRACR